MSTEPLTPNTDTDPSPYIRTYAKDMARLSGQELPASTIVAPPPVIKKEASSSKIKTSIPDADDSLIVHKEEPEVAPELSQLEKEAEIRDERVTAAEQEITSSLSAPKIPVPPPIQAVIPPSPIPAETPTDNATVPAQRESLLERLRARASMRPTHDAPDAQVIQPILPQKIETDIPEEERNIQVPMPAPAAVPETIPAPIPAPEPEPEPEPKPSPFHSFTTDFADRIDSQRASTFSVLAAEKDATPSAPAPKRKSSNILPIVAGIVLIIAGATGIFAAYHYMQTKAPVAVIQSVPTLITPDSEVALPGPDFLQELVQESNQSIPQGQVVVTYSVLSTTTPQGVEHIPQSGGVLFAALGLNVPDILSRNIDPSSTVGIVHAGTETRPFFLLRVDSYERTFAGMLEWEDTLPQDIQALYPTYPAETNASSTASSTPITSIAPPTQFTDAIVASHSVRVLRDAQGRSIMLYGYTADKQTLIIARDEAAFTLLVNRLASSGN